MIEFAQVVDAYQNVLNEVKLRLTELGYSATTRMKTTGTLVDKLRRETARLSQVQDLAGARIVVPERVAQEEAVSRISAAFESAGCTFRIIDRRERHSHGYRAVHIVVQVDKVPVEIQVRTDLQDSWAQLMERLADMWGRGIRYGEQPDLPAVDDDGERLRDWRREMVSGLMRLSEMIAKIEVFPERQRILSQAVGKIETIVRVFVPEEDALMIIEDRFDEGELNELEQWIVSLATNEAAPHFVEWRRMTVAQLGEALEQTFGIARRDLDWNWNMLRDLEADLRSTLSEFARAIGEG